MKTIKIFAFLLSLVILASCGTSHDVVDGGLFQKRKYNKGYHVSKKTKVQPAQKLDNEEVAGTVKNVEIETTAESTKTITEATSDLIKTSDKEEEVATNTVIVEKSASKEVSAKEKESDLKQSNPVPTKRKKGNKIANKVLNQFNLGEIASTGSTSADGSLLNIILAVILVIAIIMVLSFIDGLLGGLLGLVLLIIIIVLLLRYFGII